ncbi:hypothetical protein BB558_007347 [Smittium angustum]|nr:hypothetical protein BB558_007347 [Smittium angustum]
MNTHNKNPNNTKYTGFVFQSPSSKSKISKKLYEFAKNISGGYILDLFHYFIDKNKNGKDIKIYLDESFEENKIALNILSMHNNLEKNTFQKSNILSLIADSKSRDGLKKMGFKISNSQYTLAKIKAQNKIFSVTKKIAGIKGKSDAGDPKTKSLILKYLYLNSRNSRYQCYIKNNNKRTQTPVRFLDKSKNDIYLDNISNNPNLHISLDSFYKMIPNNFKKGKKKTDMCPVCHKEKINEKKLHMSEQYRLSSYYYIQSLKIEVDFYKKHYNS